MRPNLEQRATIADVARLAGVSTKTVSRVVNKEPHVSPKLKHKVEAAIAALNYVPDPAARSLAGARSFTIGVLFDNPSPNYITEIQMGAYSACMEAGYHLRIDHMDTTAPPEKVEARLMAILRNARSDGFILTPPISDNAATLTFLEKAGVRYSRVAPLLDEGRSPAVFMDDYAAAGEVAEMFWNLGHRRMAILNGPPNHGAARRRRAGFLDKLRDLGSKSEAVEAQGNFQFDDGISATRELLSSNKHVTALFAANDDSAAGAMVACAEAGLSIPGDISICGFDDSWIARTVWPNLTTIHQPISGMGHAAAELLIGQQHKRGEDQILLPHQLVMRHSVTVAPRARGADETT